MTARELNEIVQLLRAAARLDVMPHWRKLEQGDIRAKSGPMDLVTVADEAAEARITTGLERLFPGCVVVGEEATSADPALTGGIATAELCFTVDPIDGTANFCAGLPLFGTMAAAIERGRVVACAIHDPVGDDTAVALAGQGAWLEAPDGSRRALRVAPARPVSEMSGGVSWRYLAEPLRTTVLHNLARLSGTWDLRCAAHQYRILAAGHCHFQVWNRLLPWDHAPGWLLHREAGGYSARLDGSGYDPAETSGGLICTPDRASWTMLRQALLDPPGAAPARQ